MGAKNHGIVLPDASVDATLNALVAAGFGAAGQRCMALSTVVFVGDSKSWYFLIDPNLKLEESFCSVVVWDCDISLSFVSFILLRLTSSIFYQTTKLKPLVLWLPFYFPNCLLSMFSFHFTDQTHETFRTSKLLVQWELEYLTKELRLSSFLLHSSCHFYLN